MKIAHLAFAAGIITFLSSCKQNESLENTLDKFEAGWTISKTFEVDKDSIQNIPKQKIADDTRAYISGFYVWFNGLMPDSRETVMDYTEWTRILTSSKLSVEDRGMKVAMLGGSGTIYPFQYEKGNRGFLVIDSKIPNAWAEIWDHEGVRRVRIDFMDPRPKIADVQTFLKTLAIIEWPTEGAEQVAP